MDPRIRLVAKLVEEQKGAICLTLRVSSELMGVSQAHLLRLFKREIGITFRQYLRNCRMMHAAKLMGDHSLSIKSIALISGYFDVSNFYRDFRQTHGMTPQTFRIRQLVLSVEKPPEANAGALDIRPSSTVNSRG